MAVQNSVFHKNVNYNYCCYFPTKIRDIVTLAPDDHLVCIMF